MNERKLSKSLESNSNKNEIKAEELLNKHKEEMIEVMQNDVEGVSPFKQNLIKHYLKGIPENLLKRYNAHGINRNGDKACLNALISILETQKIKGMYGRFDNYMQNPFTSGPAMIFSKKDLDLGKRIEDELEVDKDGFFKADIGAFVLNRKFYPLYEDLKQMYPDQNIIKASELPEYLQLDY